jgi:chemotaxis response regulator CheB
MTKNHFPLSTENTDNKIATSRLIAVGASAGGLEALKVFFRNLAGG